MKSDAHEPSARCHMRAANQCAPVPHRRASQSTIGRWRCASARDSALTSAVALWHRSDA